MIVMKRPQGQSGIPAKKAQTIQQGMNTAQQQNHSRNIPVQHVPPMQQQQWQHNPQQMPVPQPTGSYPQSNQDHARPSQRERKVPIRVEHGNEPARNNPSNPQNSGNYTAQNVQTHAQAHGRPSNNDHHNVTRTATGPNMPQPQYPNSGNGFTAEIPKDNYTTPKPAAPAPKPQWVDPRVTEAINTIEKLSEEAESLGKRADSLQITSKDKNYLMLEEQLTKMLLKLDSIDSLGSNDVRSKRKACIRQVQQTLDALELKVMS